MTWLELSGRASIEANHILADKLTVAMSLIVGIVGCHSEIARLSGI